VEKCIISIAKSEKRGFPLMFYSQASELMLRRVGAKISHMQPHNHNLIKTP
jgi:hypothetical protein